MPPKSGFWKKGTVEDPVETYYNLYVEPHIDKCLELCGDDAEKTKVIDFFLEIEPDVHLNKLLDLVNSLPSRELKPRMKFPNDKSTEVLTYLFKLLLKNVSYEDFTKDPTVEIMAIDHRDDKIRHLLEKLPEFIRAKLSAQRDELAKTAMPTPQCC